MSQNHEKFYKNLPVTPGVYVMKNARGAVMYVGKAVNLKRRVASYFLRPQNDRIEALVWEISKIDYVATDSGLEALILEAKLIKRWEPKYNIREKDGKSFLYVEFGRGAYPSVRMVRGTHEVRGTRFGPFVSASSLRSALGIIRRIFPWSDHPVPEFTAPSAQNKKRTRYIAGPDKPFSAVQSKPCFNYQIGLCPGTCIGAVTRAEYAANIRNLKLFFRGEKKRIMQSLEREMHAAAKATNFEHAERLKRQIFALQHIQDVATVKEDDIGIIEGPALLARRSFAKAGSRVEGYDISNISGTSAVGAMVVFTDGRPEKAEYRLFNIRTVTGSDDVGMMREVLERRLENKKWPLPDLILVDGGEGHVNMANAVLLSRKLDIPVVGLAKGADRKNNRFVGDIPPKISEKTLISVRDEAHRFSRSAHIRRRGKAFFA